MPGVDFTTLETSRLRLRHFTDSDLPAFMAYRNDPEVARYQSWEGISEPEAHAFLQEQKMLQPGVLTYAFLTFDLHRIIAITDCENTASVALLERLGMRREGHFLQNAWFKGKWGDEYLYAILKEEWLRKQGTKAS